VSCVGVAQNNEQRLPLSEPTVDLVQVAWPHEQSLFPGLKQRLGLIFCFSRECHLVATTRPVSSLPSQSTPASPAVHLAKIEFQPPLVSSMEARVDRVSGCGGLVFVSHDQVRLLWTHALGTHHGCSIREIFPEIDGCPPSCLPTVFLALTIAVLAQACRTGVHNAAISLHSASWQEICSHLQQISITPTDGPTVVRVAQRCLVDVPENVATGSADFPGLYSATLSATLLPEQPFVGASQQQGPAVGGRSTDASVCWVPHPENRSNK
jgi:hypothetical protein